MDGQEVADILRYIVHERSSEKKYPNGIRDKGRNSVSLAHFLCHKNAQVPSSHQTNPKPLQDGIWENVWCEITLREKQAFTQAGAWVLVYSCSCYTGFAVSMGLALL